MTLALIHVNLSVEDVAAARRFWGGVLGLVEIPRAEGSLRPGVWYRVGALELHISEEADPRNGASKRHVAFEVEDLETMRRTLEAAGAPIEPGSPMPGIVRFFTRDPSGNRIELQQKRP